jgi:hypothetical protein
MDVMASLLPKRLVLRAMALGAAALLLTAIASWTVLFTLLLLGFYAGYDGVVIAVIATLTFGFGFFVYVLAAVCRSLKDDRSASL